MIQKPPLFIGRSENSAKASNPARVTSTLGSKIVWLPAVAHRHDHSDHSAIANGHLENLKQLAFAQIRAQTLVHLPFAFALRLSCIRAIKFR